jgi:hypothetical protein
VVKNMAPWPPLLVVSLVGLLAVRPALAAEVTTIPPFLRADIQVQYDLGLETGHLDQDEQTVGQRLIMAHDLVYEVAFGAAPGVAVFTTLPQNVATNVTYPSANAMIYDPSAQAGTMIGTDPLDPTPTVTGSGFEGAWFGIRGTPFSEAFPTRGNRATWLVEGAFQAPDATNFWTAGDGKRGGGPGGSAWLLRTAFSTTRGVSQPYVDFSYLARNTFETDLYDPDGTLLASAVTLNPGNVAQVLAGTELVASDNKEAHRRVAFDLRLGFSYHSWRTIQSGVLLPSILEGSEAVAVTEGEFSTVGAGFGFYYQAFEYLQFNLRGDASYVTPHNIEHPYPIFTGGNTLDVAVNAGFKVMVR